MGDTPVVVGTESEDTDTQQLLADCDDLSRQYDALEKEGKVLVKDLHAAIDKGNMKQVLKKIIHQS